MALKEYTLTTAEGGETTVQLDSEDAERYGDRVKPLSRAKKGAAANTAAAPANKAGGASDKQAAAAAESFGGAKA